MVYHDPPQYYAISADIARKTGNLKEAEEYINKAIELDPGNVEYHILRANILQKQFKTERHLENFILQKHLIKKMLKYIN